MSRFDLHQSNRLFFYQPCPGGHQCSRNAIPEACTDGYYAFSGSCFPCPAGYRCPDASELPVICSARYYTEGSSIHCSPCPNSIHPAHMQVMPVCSVYHALQALIVPLNDYQFIIHINLVTSLTQLVQSSVLFVLQVTVVLIIQQLLVCALRELLTLSG